MTPRGHKQQPIGTNKALMALIKFPKEAPSGNAQLWGGGRHSFVESSVRMALQCPEKNVGAKKNPKIGRTPKGAYSTRGRSAHLLETPFSEPLLRTLLRTPFYCKTHIRPPSQNPSENPFPRTLPRTFSEPFSERCVAVRPLRRAPYKTKKSHEQHQNFF